MLAAKSSNTPLPRGVRRALGAMRADVARDWSVADLADVAGLTTRTLQRQFRIFLGKAPSAVLRDIRSECARRELIQGSPDVKVMDVALRCGFPHFGRFSVEYRRRYGETPSQTRRRQAVFANALGSMPAFFAADNTRPTIALRPIEAPPEHAEVARHMADEVATALTRAGISVASQPCQAQYQLTGVIRGLHRQTNLTFRLIDKATGHHLWAHRTDGALGSDATPGEHLATRIVAALQPGLRRAEIHRARHKPDAELSAHDLALRAMPGVLSLDADGNARALDLLERARDLDPNDAVATALAAWAHGQRVVYHFTANPAEERARGLDLARKAQALASDAAVLAILGNAFTLLKDLEAAELAIQKALAFDGGSAWAWSRSGWIDLYNGNAESAIERFKIGLDLAPHDCLAFNSFVGIGCAHFQAGCYAKAAYWQNLALLEHPSSIWVHRTLCPAYVLGDAGPEARRSLSALREEYPELTVSDLPMGLPPLPPAYCGLVLDAMHSVGLPP